MMLFLCRLQKSFDSSYRSYILLYIQKINVFQYFLSYSGSKDGRFNTMNGITLLSIL